MKYLSLLLIVFSITASGQVVDSKISKKNSLHTTGTIRFDIGLSATASYERVLFKDSLSKHLLYFKGEFGGLIVLDGDVGSIIGTQVGYLYGERRGHLEIAIGFFMINHDGHSQAHGSPAVSYRPSALLGYREHNPGGWFIFRYGFSYPLGVYFGVGVAF